MKLLLLKFCVGGKSIVTILARLKFGLGFGGISNQFNEIIESEGLDIFLDKNFVILSHHEEF